MISYIKLFGPPINEALIQLETIAVDMPQVSIWDTHILRDIPSGLARDIGGQSNDWVMRYYGKRGIVISGERCQSIISSSGDSLGDFDFFYEWLEGPSMDQLSILIDNIDDALHSVGCRYTITTK